MREGFESSVLSLYHFSSKKSTVFDKAGYGQDGL